MPNSLTSFLRAHIARHPPDLLPVAIVQIDHVSGSSPRDVGTSMIVTLDGVDGTIGGGRLEWDAIAAARALLAGKKTQQITSVTLGPSTGQCCGGQVILRTNQLDVQAITDLLAQESAVKPADIYIYGSGHVGRALARAMAPLPFATVLVDSRQEELARCEAEGVCLMPTEKPLSIVEQAPEGSAHVIMTHSHALDSLIAAAVLEQDRFGYLGIIGSRTKRNSFRKAFREIGIPAERIARIVCPIGGNGVKDKRPEVIAALAAAEIATAMLGKNGG